MRERGKLLQMIHELVDDNGWREVPLNHPGAPPTRASMARYVSHLISLVVVSVPNEAVACRDGREGLMGRCRTGSNDTSASASQMLCRCDVCA